MRAGVPQLGSVECGQLPLLSDPRRWVLHSLRVLHALAARIGLHHQGEGLQRPMHAVAAAALTSADTAAVAAATLTSALTSAGAAAVAAATLTSPLALAAAALALAATALTSALATASLALAAAGSPQLLPHLRWHLARR